MTKRLATRKIEKPMYRRDDEGELTSWVFSSSSTAPKNLVAQHVAGLVGLPATRVLTGAELDQCHDEALSLFTELVVRTRRWFFQSRPGNLLLVSTWLLIPVTFTIPVSATRRHHWFVPVPVSLLVALAGMTVLYVAATELLKGWFYMRAARHRCQG